MKIFLVALFLFALPSSAFAQTELTKFPVGTCQQLSSSGLYQQLSDGTWASPRDPLNTCLTDNNQIPGWNNWPSQNQYNPALGQMTYQEWLINCVISQSIFPRPECQGYNPSIYGSSNGSNWYNDLLRYPAFGRDYLSLSTGNLALNLDLSNSKNKWSDLLIGVGMGWLLNRLTS